MRKLLVFPVLCVLTYCAQAQVPADAYNAPQTYQLYLNEILESVEEVHYNDEMSTPVHFELGDDSGTLYLLEYPKRGSVTIKATNQQGNAVEIRRSSCFIDPVVPS